MRIMRVPALVGLLAVLLLVLGLTPVRAADPLIPVSSAQDLALPAAKLPSGFTQQQGKAGPLTDAALKPVLGTYILGYFHKNGLITGYQAWYNAAAPDGAPFVVYDLYAFKTSNGARLSRIAFQALIPGVDAPVQDPSLPRSAAIWTDTGTFGPNGQPYAVAEIVFRIANVVGHVTGYYAGSGLTAINGALQQATAVTAACVRWLSARLAATQQSLVPLVPLVILPGALGRARRR